MDSTDKTDNTATNFLIVEDDSTLGSVTSKALSRRGYDVSWVSTLDEAKAIIATKQFDLALLDLKLAKETTMSLIPILRDHNAEMKILVLTGYASIATAVEAVKRGANNYLPKPATIKDILNALEQTELEGVNTEEEFSAKVMSTKRLEWEHIQRVLNENDGNVSATARELNMHRRTLQRKLQKFPTKDPKI
ncbi:MAG: two-component system response regulator [Alteromonadaceae bacterium]|nr:MAG: two-component system response regulator [Alteromonadaceae bacterium]